MFSSGTLSLWTSEFGHKSNFIQQISLYQHVYDLEYKTSYIEKMIIKIISADLCALFWHALIINRLSWTFVKKNLEKM